MKTVCLICFILHTSGYSNTEYKKQENTLLSPQKSGHEHMNIKKARQNCTLLNAGTRRMDKYLEARKKSDVPNRFTFQAKSCHPAPTPCSYL